MSISSDNIPLSHDLIISILSWLPVKSLYRFKSLSKACLFQISEDPQFAKLHKENQKPKLLFTYGESVNLVEIDYANHAVKNLQKYPYDNSLQILGCYNGLVFVLNRYKGRCYLWNPSNGDYMVIPHLCLFFEGKISGFGYDATTDDYKVIYAESGSTVCIYGVKANSWRRVEDLSFEFYILSPECYIVEGNPHWRVTMSMGDYDNAIVRFDLAKEKFEMVPLPNTSRLGAWKLKVLRDSLCVVNQKYVDYNFYFVVWVMKKDGGEEFWTQLFQVKDVKIVSSLIPMELLCTTKEGLVVLATGGEEIAICCQNTCPLLGQSLEIVYKIKVHMDQVITYEESLVSFNRTGNMMNGRNRNTSPSLSSSLLYLEPSQCFVTVSLVFVAFFYLLLANRLS